MSKAEVWKWFLSCFRLIHLVAKKLLGLIISSNDSEHNKGTAAFTSQAKLFYVLLDSKYYSKLYTLGLTHFITKVSKNVLIFQ